jgi:predicted nucleotidyltransferase
MNIKILKPLPEHLITGTFPFGSRVYGNHIDESDFDFLKIVNFDTGDVVLQYKDGDIDYVYTSLKSFLRDLEEGASQVNFEVLHTEEFQSHFKIDPIVFYTETNAKAFVGFARRDLEYPQRVFHINRCIYIAENIMKKELIKLEDIGKIVIENDMEKLTNRVTELRNMLRHGGR